MFANCSRTKNEHRTLKIGHFRTPSQKDPSTLSAKGVRTAVPLEQVAGPSTPPTVGIRSADPQDGPRAPTPRARRCSSLLTAAVRRLSIGPPPHSPRQCCLTWHGWYQVFDNGGRGRTAENSPFGASAAFWALTFIMPSLLPACELHAAEAEMQPPWLHILGIMVG